MAGRVRKMSRRKRTTTMAAQKSLPEKLTLTDVERLELDNVATKMQSAEMELQVIQNKFKEAFARFRAMHAAWAERLGKRVDIDPAVLIKEYRFNADTGEAILKETEASPAAA